MKVRISELLMKRAILGEGMSCSQFTFQFLSSSHAVARFSEFQEEILKEFFKLLEERRELFQDEIFFQFSIFSNGFKTIHINDGIVVLQIGPTQFTSGKYSIANPSGFLSLPRKIEGEKNMTKVLTKSQLDVIKLRREKIRLFSKDLVRTILHRNPIPT